MSPFARHQVAKLESQERFSACQAQGAVFPALRASAWALQPPLPQALQINNEVQKACIRVRCRAQARWVSTFKPRRASATMPFSRMCECKRLAQG